MGHIGLDRLVCPGSTDPSGIFIATNTFIYNTDIDFVSIFPFSGTNCQLDPYVHMNGNSLTAVGFQSGCNDLILGRLRFSGLTHHILMIAGLEAQCNYEGFPVINNPSVLVKSFTNNGNVEYELNDFISIIPSADDNVMHASFAQDDVSFSAITESAQISLLGDLLLASIRINNTLLSFSGNISLYNM